VQQNQSSEAQLFRIAACIEYDGSHYVGWQKQSDPKLPTVQFELEKALSKIANQALVIVCAGRTDRGVHATGQIVHFDVPIDRGPKAWVMGANSLLPNSIRVKWAKAVDADFHARFRATARQYLYLLYEANTAPALLARQLTHSSKTLDVDLMAESGQYLLGEHDFSAFRAAGCQSKSPNRCVHWLKIARVNRFIVIDIKANAFLQHMVRNIVGMLLEIGRGDKAPQWAQELLLTRDRTAGGITASPNGLYLVNVDYPHRFALPVAESVPSFLQPYS
jgi:tRNA pseudouridine38-40 synthase